MKWLQHMTNSRRDPKLRSVMRKFGPKAFGIYWICNEIIAENLDTNLTCVIEHEIDDLSDEMQLKPKELKPILDELVKKELLKKIGEKYQNPKVIHYADEWTKKKLRKLSLSEIERLRRDFGVTLELLRPEGKGSEEKVSEEK